MKDSTGIIFQLKINLVGSRPEIWRRIVVPSGYTFFDLHVAIQDAFGWTESHLHQFFTASPYQTKIKYERIKIPHPDDEEFFDDEKVHDERKTLLSQYLRKSKDTVYYEYDFGDSWMHHVTLEKILSAQAKEKYPKILAGKRAGPPEDCGGIWGYYNLLDILKDPKREEHIDMLDWLAIEKPEEFNANAFELGDVVFSDPKVELKRYNQYFG